MIQRTAYVNECFWHSLQLTVTFLRFSVWSKVAHHSVSLMCFWTAVYWNSAGLQKLWALIITHHYALFVPITRQLTTIDQCLKEADYRIARRTNNLQKNFIRTHTVSNQTQNQQFVAFIWRTAATNVRWSWQITLPTANIIWFWS